MKRLLAIVLVCLFFLAAAYLSGRYDIFTDDWWTWFAHQYSYSMVIVWALLKTVALLDPTNKSNEILDSFRTILSAGNSSMSRRASDPKEAAPDK